MTPLVEAKGVRMAFDGGEVLRGVDISLNAGEVHAIVGENGAGKSTLAKIIAGVHRPTAGSLQIEGNAVRFGSPREAAAHGVALIHQEPLTFPGLTVAENIFVGHLPHSRLGIDWATMGREASRILAQVGATFRPDTNAGDLSVADRQLVEMAAALSQNARVLLLDETTASLTPKEVAELFAIVRGLRDRGCALAFVSHHLDEVFAIADRITVLRDGEKVGELDPRSTTEPDVVKLMVGRSVDLRRHERPKPTAAPILTVRGLTLDRRVTEVDFDLVPGEILGFGGLVGAGRTEVCRCLFGLEAATEGDIRIGGQPGPRSPREALRLGLGMVSEDRQQEGLVLSMNLRENSTLANLRKIARRGWLQRHAEEQVTTQALTALRTAYRSIDQKASELSGGNQQKVALAKWLMTKPRVLILDEPTRGVDVGAKEEVHRLIRELADGGIAILLVSSDLPELLSLSDRILVMRQGRIVAEIDGAAADGTSVMMAATGQGAHAA